MEKELRLREVKEYSEDDTMVKWQSQGKPSTVSRVNTLRYLISTGNMNEMPNGMNVTLPHSLPGGRTNKGRKK